MKKNNKIKKSVSVLAFLFEKLQNDCEKADLLKAMLDEYEVSEEKASADIDTFIQKLREADVLE